MICLRPLQGDNSLSSYRFARWHLLWHVGYLRHQQQVLTFDLLTLKVVFESCATWATSVPMFVFLGLCSRVTPDVCDRRQTDKRQTKSIALFLRRLTAGHNLMILLVLLVLCNVCCFCVCMQFYCLLLLLLPFLA